MAKLAFALIVLVGLAAAQGTCPCSRNTGPSCSGITSNGNGRCSTTTNACSGCACDAGGLETCEVTTQQVLKFNGTADFCGIEPIPVAECPGTSIIVTERECCFSGFQGFLVTCNLGTPVPGISSISYDYNVDGLGSFVFQEPSEPLEVTIGMTASSTPTAGPAFMQAQVGTNSTSASINAGSLTPSLTTSFEEAVGPFNSGPRFDYLVANPSFTFLLSANLGESGGDASRSSNLEGCMNFQFTSGGF